MLEGAGILIHEDHLMRDNQQINTAQVAATIDHSSISLRVTKHTKHAIAVELPGGVTVLVDVQLTLLLKCCNNLNNRKAYKTQSHQMTSLPHNLLICHYHPHQFHQLNHLTHFSVLLFPQRIVSA
jgi:hypothetical protein